MPNCYMLISLRFPIKLVIHHICDMMTMTKMEYHSNFWYMLSLDDTKILHLIIEKLRHFSLNNTYPRTKIYRLMLLHTGAKKYSHDACFASLGNICISTLPVVTRKPKTPRMLLNAVIGTFLILASAVMFHLMEIC